MNAAEAHRTLLVRAFETPLAAPWTEADAAWASAEAAREEGERPSADRLIARRAAVAAERLAGRDPAIAAALKTTGGHGGLAWGVIALGFGCGLALDSIGPTQRLNIVALPMLGVLVWNLAVYALLLLHAAKGSGAATGGTWLHARLGAWIGRNASRAETPALRRYFIDTTAASRALHAERIAFVLHAGAAALAAGMLSSMYARGLAFEYRAGWDSTFLDADGVRRLLSVVLWPALTLTGGTLPTPDQLAALRFSAGPGENAAQWIHWLALTVALLVLLPRGVLAMRAAQRARRLTQDFPIDLSEPYFQRLLRAPSDAATRVQVLPYSYRIAAELLPGLQAVLERALGARVELALADSLPVGSEDDLPRFLQAADRAQLPSHAARLPLFSLTATPERETHAAFLRALAEASSDARNQARFDARFDVRFDVLIDESAFRRSFDAKRLTQRRAAWQKLLADVGRRALFVDLAQPDLEAIDAALQDSRTRATASSA